MGVRVRFWNNLEYAGWFAFGLGMGIAAILGGVALIVVAGR
jgi:hypothetical protein